MSADHKENKKKLSIYVNFLISSTSATIAKTVAAPIERVKLLLQNQQVIKELDKKYTGNFDCMKRVYNEQGFLSFWRGNFANVVRYVPMFALSYSFKELFRKYVKKPETRSKEIINNLLTAGVAGSLSIILTYPLDFARTRLGVSVKGKGQVKEYSGIIDCIIKNYKAEGIRGVFAGFWANILGNFVYRGFLFGLHDSKPDHGGFLFQFFMSFVTSAFATMVTMPFDTVKRRLMVQIGTPNKFYDGYKHCITSIISQEGVSGFFKGGYANVIKCLGLATTLIINDKIIMFYVKILHLS